MVNQRAFPRKLPVSKAIGKAKEWGKNEKKKLFKVVL
jgi:hypothetical protein